VRANFLEDVLEKTGYKLTSFNQIDDYGQENQITALVEVHAILKNLDFLWYISEAFEL